MFYLFSWLFHCAQCIVFIHQSIDHYVSKIIVIGFVRRVFTLPGFLIRRRFFRLMLTTPQCTNSKCFQQTCRSCADTLLFLPGDVGFSNERMCLLMYTVYRHAHSSQGQPDCFVARKFYFHRIDSFVKIDQTNVVEALNIKTD